LNPDAKVTVGSPAAPFSQNKQNEPTVAVDAAHPNILVAGSNDNIDMEACNAGDDTTCPFTPNVGASGVYFSFDSGTSWTQPTYTGLSGRSCLGVVGNGDPGCTATTGPIGTLPHYAENGLVADGDPGVAFGPRLDANGTFSWAAGSRLYYSNLTSNVGATLNEQAFKGFEAIAVSHADNVQAAAAGDASAWSSPVLVSRQSSTTFSDKSQIWADNAASSPFFGTVYVCWAAFLGQEKATPRPRRSRSPSRTTAVPPGSSIRSARRRTTASASPTDGCTIRTDSHGNAYVFGIGTAPSQGKASFELMSRSTNGGGTWSRGTPVAGPVTQPGLFDPALGRPTIDGIAGARSDLAPAPSVDIANGAPTGSDASNRIVMTYVSGDISAPHVYFTESTDGGSTWSTPRAIETAATAASTPRRRSRRTERTCTSSTTRSRRRTGRTRPTRGRSSASSSTPTARPIPARPQGRSPSCTAARPATRAARRRTTSSAEFLGDYVYAAATRTYGAAVWNDTRLAADCPAIDAWRMSQETGGSVPRPAPQQDCAPSFGNSDIFGGTYPDPTP
jgi:hypothetical protein